MRALLDCVNHPGTPALFECKQCRTHVCNACAKHIWQEDRFADLCPNCDWELAEIHGVAEQLQEVADIPDPGPVSYAERIPHFLLFPFNSSVLFICLGLAVLTAPLYWAVRNNISFALALIGIMIIRGLEISVYFRFVHKTAFGEKEMTPPDATDLVEDLFAPLFRYLVALVPCIAAIMWFGKLEYDSVWFGMLLFEADPWAILDHTGPAVLLVAGVALLPLLTIIAAISGSALSVLNPALWARALRVFGSTYLVAMIAFYAVITFEYLGLLPLLIRFNQDVDIFIVTTLVTLVISYLAMALRARILGGLGEPYLRHFD